MNAEIQYYKDYLKQIGMTYEQLSEKSGIPLNTLKNIFRGKTAHPRIDTVQAIERALGLATQGKKQNDIPTDQREQIIRRTKMDIERLREAKKKQKLSYDDLAKITGYSRSTITNIFCGYCEFPRHETIEAIERALGITVQEETQETTPTLTEEEKKLIELIGEMTDEEVNELSNFIDFIISKRK